MSLNFTLDSAKSDVFVQVRAFVENAGFYITQHDDTRPWGGFFYIDEGQAPLFISTFFPHLDVADFAGFPKLSPKILIVAPDKRLSWQYHHRRAEIWKLIGGVAGIVVSDTDTQTPQRDLSVGEVVELARGERHRLVGTSGWGIVAEIWKHTEAGHPSDEDDIVRVEDDFGR